MSRVSRWEEQTDERDKAFVDEVPDALASALLMLNATSAGA